jgi:hypothetical protein
MAEERTQILRGAIAQHLEMHGPRNWKLLWERFPDVSRASFWRHVKAVREAPADLGRNATDQTPLETGGQRLFPPFFEPLQKLAEYERLLPEAEEMGRQAMNNQGKITNWRMYAKSIDMRRDLLQEQITAAQLLLDMGKMQRLCDAVVEAIAAASPELQKDVMGRLVALHESLSSQS